MKKNIFHKIFLSLLFCFAVNFALAQKPNILKTIGDKIPAIGQTGNTGTGGNDSLQVRNRFEDSITVAVYYLDSSRASKLDSSIADFTRRFPIPATHIYLGNNGTATRSILFAPELKAGWDPGFHALDVYKLKLEKIKFFNTTRPYSELAYVLGSRAEQQIEIFHTQNIKPNWNFSINYRLINAPGVFRNQKSNHNNYAFTSWYASKSKRYNNYFVILANKLQVGENGGIQNDVDYLNDIIYAKDRFIIPTKIGGSPTYSPNFFSNALVTGN